MLLDDPVGQGETADGDVGKSGPKNNGGRREATKVVIAKYSL